MTLNRNPDNFFAETEQVAFHPGHIVPGIDFTNDPLLQGRLFSYPDTQISRLGGPNFHEIPINRPVCPFHNNQRDAMHRQTINVGQASYEPNSVSGGWPKETDPAPSDGGFESYQERVEGDKIRVRSESFADHFSQAAMFYNSMSEPRKTISRGLPVRTRQGHQAGDSRARGQRDSGQFRCGACREGRRRSRLAGAEEGHGEAQGAKASPALSLLNRVKPGIKTRKIALLAAPGSDGAAIKKLQQALQGEGAAPHVDRTDACRDRRYGAGRNDCRACRRSCSMR